MASVVGTLHEASYYMVTYEILANFEEERKPLACLGSGESKDRFCDDSSPVVEVAAEMPCVWRWRKTAMLKLVYLTNQPHLLKIPIKMRV